MRKLLLFIALLTSAAYSLNAQNVVEANVNDSRILKQLPKDMVTNPVYLKGNLSTWVNAANEFVVYAESAEKKYLFVLQMQKKRDIKPATGKFESLTFIGDAMILNDGKHNYYFGLIPVSENKVLEKAHMTEKDFVNIVEGYGLSRNVVKADSNLYSLDKLKGARSVLE